MTVATPTRTPACAELRALRWGQDLDGDAARELAAFDVESLPEGWTIGKPFRCLAVGQVFQRVTGSRHAAGEQRGEAVTREHLAGIVAAFATGEAVPINREHNRAVPEGDVIAMWLVDGGDTLAVLPAYAPTLAAYVARCGGALWSSPEIAWDDNHDAATGEVLGPMLMDGVAICTHPAQAHRKLDRVRLTQGEPTNRATLAQEDPMELEQFMTAVLARFDALEQKVAALEAAMKPAETAAEEPAEGEAEGATEEMGDEKRAEMAALRAEVAALKADAAEARAEKLAAEKAAAVRELLTSGRIAPAEKAAAEAVVTKGGVELLSTVYGTRKAGHAVPQLRGHSQPVDPPEGEDDEWTAASKAARELMSADPKLAFDDAFGRVVAERQREKLTAR